MKSLVRARELEARVQASIPLARAMQARIVSFDGSRVSLSAPLTANINDKGTAFAGSLSTLATLAGWCLATLTAEDGGDRCEVAVVHTEIDFLLPVRVELSAEAWLEDPEEIEVLRRRLAAGRRARLRVSGRIGTADAPALRFGGKYAVWRVGTQPF